MSFYFQMKYFPVIGRSWLVLILVLPLESQLNILRTLPSAKLFCIQDGPKENCFISSFCKGGRFANKFRKSQIRKFADLNNLLDLWTCSKCGTLRICDLRTQSFLWFADFRKSTTTYFFSSLWHTILEFKEQNNKNCLKKRLLELFCESCAVFCENLWICTLVMKICRFVICGLVLVRICGFAIAEWTHKNVDLRFADFSKNFKSFLAHLCLLDLETGGMERMWQKTCLLGGYLVWKTDEYSSLFLVLYILWSQGSFPQSQGEMEGKFI